MYYGIPEGYYSLAQIFHFLGQDIFGEPHWKEIADECGRYRIFHEMNEFVEKRILNRLSLFWLCLDRSRHYRRYTFFNMVDWCCCNLLAHNMIHHDKEWKIKDLIGNASPPKDLQLFMEYVFRYIIVKERLVSMLENTSLRALIHDKRTDHMQEIRVSLWGKPDSVECTQKEFEYDFLTGCGSYIHYNENTKMIEPYKGFLLVKKEKYEDFRKSYFWGCSERTLIELILALEKDLKEIKETHVSKDEGQKWPSYTTPEIEALKRVLSDYGISEENQPIVKTAMGYFQKECPGMSDNLAHALATVIRTSKVKKGGFPGSPLFQDHKPIKVSEKLID